MFLEDSKPHLDHVMLYDWQRVDIHCDLEVNLREKGEVLNAWLKIDDLTNLGS